MIPKLVHFIWIQGEDHLVGYDPHFADVKRAWETYLPGYKIRVWTGEEIEELVRDHFPECMRLFHDRDINYATRSDLGRWAILHRHGGIYSDTDFRPIRSFEHFFENVDLVYYKHPLGFIEGNWVACTPGHAVVADIMDQFAKFTMPSQRPVLQSFQDWRMSMKAFPNVNSFLKDNRTRGLWGKELLTMDKNSYAKTDEQLREQYPYTIFIVDTSSSWLNPMMDKLHEWILEADYHPLPTIIIAWVLGAIAILVVLICILVWGWRRRKGSRITTPRRSQSLVT